METRYLEMMVQWKAEVSRTIMHFFTCRGNDILGPVRVHVNVDARPILNFTAGSMTPQPLAANIAQMLGEQHTSTSNLPSAEGAGRMQQQALQPGNQHHDTRSQEAPEHLNSLGSSRGAQQGHLTRGTKSEADSQGLLKENTAGQPHADAKQTAEDFRALAEQVGAAVQQGIAEGLIKTGKGPEINARELLAKYETDKENRLGADPGLNDTENNSVGHPERQLDRQRTLGHSAADKRRAEEVRARFAKSRPDDGAESINALGKSPGDTFGSDIGADRKKARSAAEDVPINHQDLAAGSALDRLDSRPEEQAQDGYPSASEDAGPTFEKAESKQRLNDGENLESGNPKSSKDERDTIAAEAAASEPGWSFSNLQHDVKNTLPTSITDNRISEALDGKKNRGGGSTTDKIHAEGPFFEGMYSNASEQEKPSSSNKPNTMAPPIIRVEQISDSDINMPFGPSKKTSDGEAKKAKEAEAKQAKEDKRRVPRINEPYAPDTYPHPGCMSRAWRRTKFGCACKCCRPCHWPWCRTQPYGGQVPYSEPMPEKIDATKVHVIRVLD